jgi:hypothetical protein
MRATSCTLSQTVTLVGIKLIARREITELLCRSAVHLLGNENHTDLLHLATPRNRKCLLYLRQRHRIRTQLKKKRVKKRRDDCEQQKPSLKQQGLRG